MLGTDLSGNIFERLVEQGSCFRGLISCKQDRLAQESTTGIVIVTTGNKGQGGPNPGVTPGGREGTHFPSKTQGLILEKSVSCESFGI